MYFLVTKYLATICHLQWHHRSMYITWIKTIIHSVLLSHCSPDFLVKLLKRSYILHCYNLKHIFRVLFQHHNWWFIYVKLPLPPQCYAPLYMSEIPLDYLRIPIIAWHISTVNILRWKSVSSGRIQEGDCVRAFGTMPHNQNVTQSTRHLITTMFNLMSSPTIAAQFV